MILLDTQAAVWLATRPERISRPASREIRKHADRRQLAVASVTLMEVGQLLASGQIRASGTPLEWLRAFVERVPFAVRDLTVEIAAVASHLPPQFPADPFDRLIAATAIVGRLPLVTADRRIAESGVVETVW